MKVQSFANVFDALEDDPVVAENLKIRADLMLFLRNHIEKNKLTQARAAKLFGVTQPRISDLMRGKINLFAIDTLVNMVTAAGLKVKLRIAKAA